MLLMCGFTEMFWALRRVFHNSLLLASWADPKKTCWFSINYAFFKKKRNFLKVNVRITRNIDTKMFGKMSNCCQNVWSTHAKDTAMEVIYRTVEKNQICRSYWRWVENQNGILLEAWRSRCNRLNWDMKECYFQDNFAIFRHSTYPLPNMDKCFRAISKNQIKKSTINHQTC